MKERNENVNSLNCVAIRISSFICVYIEIDKRGRIVDLKLIIGHKKVFLY